LRRKIEELRVEAARLLTASEETKPAAKKVAEKIKRRKTSNTELDQYQRLWLLRISGLYDYF
jgi:hypothetical protein